MDETIGETIGCNFLIGFPKSIDEIYADQVSFRY